MNSDVIRSTADELANAESLSIFTAIVQLRVLSCFTTYSSAYPVKRWLGRFFSRKCILNYCPSMG